MKQILLYFKSLFLSGHHVGKPGSATDSRKNENDGFVLITSLYNETESLRMEELMYCLNSNLSNDSIGEVVVLYDISRDDKNNKVLKALESFPQVSLHKVPGRPTFSECFSLAGREYAGRDIIVANADIYFDSSLLKINFDKIAEQFLVLSRYNDDGSHASLKPITNSQDLPNFLSADAWLFRSPVKRPFFADYKLGTMYSDSFLNTNLIGSGIKALNPCLEIKACHLQRGVSESQDAGQAKRRKFDAIYDTERVRSGKGELSTGLHWCFLPETDEELGYNYQVRWTKKNIVIDVNDHAIDRIASMVSHLNEFARRNQTSIWLYSMELRSLYRRVMPMRNELVNLTRICNPTKFFEPVTSNHLPDVMKVYDNVLINQEMIDSFFRLVKDSLQDKTSLPKRIHYKTTNPKVYIDVQFGLSNRLRALASAFLIARSLRRELVLIWEPDVHCNCHFNDLFVNHCLNVESRNVVSVDNMDCYDYMNGPLRREGKLRLNLKTNKDIYVKSAYTLDYKLYDKNEEDLFLQSLRPISQVSDRVSSYDLSDLVGLHVRMGGGENFDADLWDSDKYLDAKGKELMNYWRGKSHFKTFLPLVTHILENNPDQKFYLAADLQLIYDVFVEKFGDQIIFHQRDVFDRSLEQQITALIDLYCLSKTRLIYGSNWSSFSEVASRLGNKEVKLSGVHF